MGLPDIKYRKLFYKACLVLIPVITALGASGIIPLAVAGGIGTVLSFLSNLLAERATTALQKDGTLILTGTVQDQVNKGIDILAQGAVDAVEGLNDVGRNLERLNDLRDRSVEVAVSVPVLGPLAAQILNQLKK
jgi:hypothetical protein